MKRQNTIYIIISILCSIFSIAVILFESNIYWRLIFSITAFLNIIVLAFSLFSLYKNNYSKKKIKETRKKYPKLSIVAIINQYYEQNVFKSIYLLLISIITYIFVAQIFSLTISINFLIIFFGLILILFLYLLVLNFRIRQGWYGGNESEAREIINFALKNSDDIDFTDNSQSKRLFNQEDIEEIFLELGIPIPGFSFTSSINQDLGRLGENK